MCSRLSIYRRGNSISLTLNDLHFELLINPLAFKVRETSEEFFSTLSDEVEAEVHLKSWYYGLLLKMLLRVLSDIELIEYPILTLCFTTKMENIKCYYNAVLTPKIVLYTVSVSELTEVSAILLNDEVVILLKPRKFESIELRKGTYLKIYSLLISDESIRSHCRIN